MRATARDFDLFVAKNVTMEWDLQRQRIFEHFGLLPKGSAATDTTLGSFGGLSAFGASSFGRSKLGASAGNGTNRSSVWAKSSIGGSVLGMSCAEQVPGAYIGNLFADVDTSRQMELSRPVQLRREQYGEAIQQMNEMRLGLNSPGGGTFPVLNTFAALTEASGNDMVCLYSYGSTQHSYMTAITTTARLL